MKYGPSLAFTAFAMLIACSDKDARQLNPGAASRDTTNTNPPGLAGPVPHAVPFATPQMLALGDSIYHGEVAGGICYSCHGGDAKGTPLAPSLVDAKWETGDGTYEFIVSRVTTGMPSPPPPYSSPMLPKGGAPLTDTQVRAVAAYVYSISH
jgi:mono/diheme cytochrome c family protein